MPTIDRKLRVCLCRSSQDTTGVALRKPSVRELYQRLNAAPQGGDKGWIDPESASHLTRRQIPFNG